MHKSHIRLTAIIFPFLTFGVLQLAGCSAREIPPPEPGGVYRSLSGGAQFDQSVTLHDKDDVLIGDISQLTLRKIYRVKDNSQEIYAAAGAQGLIHSDDDGQTWNFIEQPLAMVASIVVIPENIILIAGSNIDGEGVLLRSLDGAKSWEKVLTIPAFKVVPSKFYQVIKPPPPPAVFVSALVANPFHDDQLYATTSTGDLLAGEQSGKVWRTVSTTTSKSVNPATGRGNDIIDEVVPSPHRDNELLLVMQNGKLFRAIDLETEEIKIPESRANVIDAIFIDQFPNSLLVGTSRGVISTRDGGETWQALPLPISTSSSLLSMVTRISPTNPNRIIVSVENIIYRSEDGGATWNSLSLGLPDHTITDISIDPNNAAHVLLTTTPPKS